MACRETMRACACVQPRLPSPLEPLQRTWTVPSFPWNVRSLSYCTSSRATAWRASPPHKTDDALPPNRPLRSSRDDLETAHRITPSQTRYPIPVPSLDELSRARCDPPDEPQHSPRWQTRPPASPPPKITADFLRRKLQIAPVDANLPNDRRHLGTHSPNIPNRTP